MKNIVLPLIVMLYMATISLILGLFGSNPASDIKIYEFMVANWRPFDEAFLSSYGQYPIFMPLLLKFFSMTGLFYYEYGINIFLCIYTFVTVFLFKDKLRDTQFLYFLVLMIPPAAIWAQDEVLALPLLLYLSMAQNKINTELIIVSVIGILVFKVFFIFYLYSYLLNSIIEKKWSIFLILLGILVIVTSVTLYGISVAGYSPRNDFTFGISSILTKLEIVGYEIQNKVGLSIFLCLTGLLTIKTLSRGRKIHAAKLSFVLMALFLVTNSHVNPEYFVFLIIPSIAMGLNPVAVSLVYIMGWFQNGINFIYRTTSMDWLLLLDVTVCLVGGVLTIVLALKNVRKTDETLP